MTSLDLASMLVGAWLEQAAKASLRDTGLWGENPEKGLNVT